MTGNDLPPLAGLASHDQPTINRVPSTPSRSASGFTPGTILAGRYRIVALLGRGGMGQVYRADDLRLGQPVALKFVDIGGDARSVENLYHEVRVARQVSHPNVCRVHDVVEADGLRFIAMEYVDGEDLASLLRRIGRLPAGKATELAREITSGLAAAHERGIVHRDLKPANVMIDGTGRAHVTDFGLASLAGSDDDRIAGTPAYMAPEQVAGQPATPRSDVYALGLVLYELFTGERVYASASFAERRKQQALTPRPASASVKEVDPAIDAVIAACLAADPAMRPASARAVLAMLPGGDAIDAAMAAGETPSPEMVAAAAETGELPLLVAGAVLAAIVIALLVVSQQSQTRLFTLMRKPPEVMRERAADIVGRAGETSEARDEVHFFDHDQALRRSRWGSLPRAQLAAMRPGIMRFIYRRSPARLTPRELVQAANDIFIFQSGRITMNDPPLDVPGSAVVVLDHNGALVNYRAHPSGKAAAPDWRPLLESTGIDMSTLAAAKPLATPPLASDARAAWSAAYQGQRERVQIEAASLNGQPAWLRVEGPWAAAEPNPSQLPVSAGAVQIILIGASTIVAIVVTRRSLRRGRSDRAGALRLAFYIAGCLFLAWLIAAHHASDPEDEARMASNGLGQAVASGVSLWMFYVALEPGVRRTWPRSLIGWTRLLAGRFRDPMVGREILIGVAGGIVSFEVFWLAPAARPWLGLPASHLVMASTIDPLSIFIGDGLISHVQAIAIAIGTIFVYLIVRKAFGKVGGPIAIVLLFAAYVLEAPAAFIFIMLVLYAMLRSGLLTGVVIGATTFLLMSAPLTLDTRAWYWPRALLVLLIVTAGAAWAARTAIGQRLRWTGQSGDERRGMLGLPGP